MPEFAYLCHGMKSIRSILAIILSLILGYLGAGVAFVHICAACCTAETCHSSSAHEEAGCASASCQAVPFEKAYARKCHCVDVSHQVDLVYQVSAQSFSIVSQFPVDLPEHLTGDVSLFSTQLLSALAPHAPPLYLMTKGRDLLALHAVLVI